MNVEELVHTVESSTDYTAFIRDNKDNYLVHVFGMSTDEGINELQVGYYDKESDKISVFEYSGGQVKLMPPQDAFKEENYIKALKLEDVHIEAEDALAVVDGVIKDNYSSESLTKSIILLQNLAEFGQIWNVTVVTTSFSVLNIKIDGDLFNAGIF